MSLRSELCVFTLFINFTMDHRLRRLGCSGDDAATLLIFDVRRQSVPPGLLSMSISFFICNVTTIHRKDAGPTAWNLRKSDSVTSHQEPWSLYRGSWTNAIFFCGSLSRRRNTSVAELLIHINDGCGHFHRTKPLVHTSFRKATCGGACPLLNCCCCLIVNVFHAEEWGDNQKVCVKAYVICGT